MVLQIFPDHQGYGGPLSRGRDHLFCAHGPDVSCWEDPGYTGFEGGVA